MIKIQFIMPYEEMREDVEAVLEAFDSPQPLEVVYSVYTFLEIVDGSIDPSCDAVVARGASAVASRQVAPSVPVVDISFTGAEVIGALIQCRRRFGSKKVAVVGPPTLSLTAELISQISGVAIVTLPLGDFARDMAGSLRRIRRAGCDTVIGGSVASLFATEHGINSMNIRTERENIWRALDEAVKIITMRRHEQEKLAILQSVVDGSNEGFVLVDEKRRLPVINALAARVFGAPSHAPGAPRPGVTVLPREIREGVERVFRTEKPCYDVLFSAGESSYAAAIRPIRIGGERRGVLVNFHNTRAIQKMEQKIRASTHAKGMTTRYTLGDILYRSQSMADCVEMARRFAGVGSNVLVLGETGTGKEMLAQGIHAASARAEQPFVAVNCAALPENLLESELFGYAGGAFTGASKNGKPGLFELAHGGTIFLDEISEVPQSFQSKLLRVLQEKDIRRIGDDKVIPIDVRVLAASNRDLLGLVERGVFRQDLYFRLNVLRIEVPPLRERFGDIPLLLHHFLDHCHRQFGTWNGGIAPEAMELLEGWRWTGNVREIQNIAEGLAVLAGAEQVEVEHIRRLLPVRPTAQQRERAGDRSQERQQLLAALEAAGSREEAARLLGISRTTLWRRMNRHQLACFTQGERETKRGT